MHIQEKSKLSNMEKDLMRIIECNEKIVDDNNLWINMKVIQKNQTLTF